MDLFVQCNSKYWNLYYRHSVYHPQVFLLHFRRLFSIAQDHRQFIGEERDDGEVVSMASCSVHRNILQVVVRGYVSKMAMV